MVMKMRQNFFSPNFSENSPKWPNHNPNLLFCLQTGHAMQRVRRRRPPEQLSILIHLFIWGLPSRTFDLGVHCPNRSSYSFLIFVLSALLFSRKISKRRIDRPADLPTRLHPQKPTTRTTTDNRTYLPSSA